MSICEWLENVFEKKNCSILHGLFCTLTAQRLLGYLLLDFDETLGTHRYKTVVKSHSTL